MYPDCRNHSRENLVRQIQELEDAYAEALADDTDARSLSSLWEEIKFLKRKIDEREELIAFPER